MGLVRHAADDGHALLSGHGGGFAGGTHGHQTVHAAGQLILHQAVQVFPVNAGFGKRCSQGLYRSREESLLHVLNSFAWRLSGLDQILGAEQLGGQNAAACRAANSIMAQAHKLIVKNAVFPQAADGNAHAVLKIPVQPRLRMGGIFAVLQEGLGRAGKLQALRFGFKAVPALEDFLRLGLWRKLTETAAM